MRHVSPEIFADEWFGMLSPIHRLLWLGLLVNIADDQGRMLDNPALIRATLFPYDDDIKLKDIEKALALFATRHRITRYGHGSNGSTRKLIQINNWWRYQKSAQWAGRSQYPAPPKWIDRIRAHETGGGIALLNWDSIGGYEAAMKQLRSGKVKTTKPLRSREDEDEVKGRGRGKAGVSEKLINGRSQKKPAPPPPSNFGRGKPRGHENLKAGE